MACWRPRASRVADVDRSRFSVIFYFLFVLYGFVLVRKTEAVLFDWKVRGHGHRSIVQRVRWIARIANDLEQEQNRNSCREKNITVIRMRNFLTENSRLIIVRHISG